MCSIAPQFEYSCSMECALEVIGDEESGSYPVNGVSEFRSEECAIHEVLRSKLEDIRNGKPIRQALERVSDRLGFTTRWVSQDRVNIQAAYRVISNRRIGKANILPAALGRTRAVCRQPRFFPSEVLT
jgi:hypothetical protein